MLKHIIGSLAVFFFTLVGTASSVQAQPRRTAAAPAPGAHVATPPNDNDVVMDGTPTDGRALTCGGPDTICLIQERQRAALEALQAQVARLAAAPSVRPAAPASSRPTVRPSAAARPTTVPVRTPIVRIRAAEVALDDLSGRFEAIVRDLPTLVALQTQCTLQRNNPQIRIPPGTDCDQVSRDLQAAQAMAARSSPLARPTARPTP